MKEYITTNTLELFSGRVGLTAKQAAIRAAKLKKVKSGLYEITGPVQFKKGETIRLAGIPKGLAAVLSEVKPKQVDQE